MNTIKSTVTDLPRSCKSAVEHMSQELAKENSFASLSENMLQKISGLEESISKDAGKNIVLIAYDA